MEFRIEHDSMGEVQVPRTVIGARRPREKFRELQDRNRKDSHGNHPGVCNLKKGGGYGQQTAWASWMRSVWT